MMNATNTLVVLVAFAASSCAVVVGCDGTSDVGRDADGAVVRVDSMDGQAGRVDGASDVQRNAATTDVASDVPTTSDANDAEADGAALPVEFVAVTWNTGTTETMGEASDDDRYTAEHARRSDEWYGDGLAWTPGVEAARAFFAEVEPDVVVFQEIFWAGNCPDIPSEEYEDFFCAGWSEGDPTVAQNILGDGYQVMCHLEKHDKCAAVNRRFGTFRGCDADICLEGMTGFRVEDCGRGARIGRGVIDLVDGGSLTLVSVHGTSGLTAEDQACRVAQFEQVFVDLGDGAPGASGDRNLVMGDFNTDPARLAVADVSAQRLNDFVGEGKAFHFVTAVGEDAPPTYAGIANIDHVISDVLDGDCWTAAVSEGHPDVIGDRYFDHHPVVCTMVLSDP